MKKMLRRGLKRVTFCYVGCLVIVTLGLGTATQVEAGETIKFSGTIGPSQSSASQTFEVNIVDSETGEPILGSDGKPKKKIVWGTIRSLEVDIKCTSPHGVCVALGLDAVPRAIVIAGAFGPENYVGWGQSVDLFSGPRTYNFGDLNGDGTDDRFTVQMEAKWAFQTRIPGDAGSFLTIVAAHEGITDPLISEIRNCTSGSPPSCEQTIFACGIDYFNEEECATGMFARASGSIRVHGLFDDVVYDFVSGSFQGIIILP